MLGEAVAAMVVGVVAVWLLLQPLMKSSRKSPPVIEPVDVEDTPKGVALSALKEIEFDRETGKLSDQDYELLKSRYTAAALEALRTETETSALEPVSDDIESMVAARVRALRFASAPISPDAPNHPASAGPACSSCGPRPEPDALFCSTCGRRLPAGSTCVGCGAALTATNTFCESCGRVVAA